MPLRRLPLLAPLLAPAMALGLLGCRDVLGIEDTPPLPDGASASSASGATSTATTTTGGSGGAPSTATTGGQGGQGGEGGAGGAPPPDFVLHVRGRGDASVLSVAFDDDGRTALVAQFSGELVLPGSDPIQGPEGETGVIALLVEADGTIGWSQLLGSVAFGESGGGHDVDIAFAPDGSVVVAGTIPTGSFTLDDETVLPVNGFPDMFAARYDDGQLVAHRQWGDANSQLGSGLDVGSDGSIYLVGGFCGSLELPPVTLTGGVCGGGGRIAGFVARLDPEMNGLDGRVVDADPGFRLVYAVDADDAGQVAISGFFRQSVELDGTADVLVATSDQNEGFIAKLDPELDGIFARRLGEGRFGFAQLGEGDTTFVSALVTEAPAFVDSLPAPQGLDTFGARLDPTGGVMWARLWGGPGNEDGGLRLEPDGTLGLYGAFSEEVTFGDTTLGTDAGDGMHLVLDPATGEVLEAEALGATAKGRLFAGRREESSEILVGTFGGTVDLGEGPIDGDTIDVFVARRPR